MAAQRRTAYSQYALPAAPTPIALTEDDDQILLAVYRHDLIDAHAIRTLLPHRSADKVGRRLKLLHENQYLHRLRQLEKIFVDGGGSLPKAYTLGAKGAERLRERFSLPTKSRRFRERAESISAPMIEHGLEVSRFLIQMRSAAAQHEDVEFFYPDQIYERYAPDILKRDSLPSLLSARVNWYGYREIEGTIPDGFFMLRYPRLPEGKNRRFIFLEIDRGTETIDVSERKSKTLKFWKDTSVLRKFVVYAYAWKTGAHKRKFGIPTFQVLTVTTNNRRVAAMQRMYRKRLAGRPHSVPPARFLFADGSEESNCEDDLLSKLVWDGMGDEYRLGPR